MHKEADMELHELSQIIQSKRKEQGYTQKELASLCALSTRTLATIENGFEVDVGIQKVMMTLDILGYELDIRPKKRPLTLDELNRQNNERA